MADQTAKLKLQIETEGLSQAQSGLDGLKSELSSIAKAPQGNLSKEALDIAEASGSASSGLSKLGSAISALGGGSIVSDIGDIVGSLEALKDVKGVAGALSTVGIGIKGLLVATGVGAALIALTAVMSALGGQASETAEDMARTYDAIREVNDAIRSGTTTEDAIKTAEELRALLKDEQSIREEQLEAERKRFEELQNSIPIVGDFFARLAKLFGFDAFGGFNAEIEKTETNIEDASEKLAKYDDAIKQNKFAANDASEAAKEYAEQLEDESKERDKINKDIAKSTKDFDKDLVDFERESQQQRSDLAMKLSQDLKNANRELAQATEDISKNLKRTISDLNTALTRDLTDIATKSQREMMDAVIKAQDEESKNVRAHLNDIEDIRKDAFRSEKDAIRNRDALALADARETAKQQLDDAQTAFDRDRNEQIIAFNESRRDQIRALDRERSDRLLNYQRSLSDARMNAQRELDDARVARTRSIALAQEAYRNELTQLNQKLKLELQLKQEAFKMEIQLLREALSAVGAVTNNNTINTNITSTASAPQIEGIVLRTLQQVGLTQ